MSEALSTKLTAAEIADAKKRVKYQHGNVEDEHDDCVRIAYQWLDAQIMTKRMLGRSYPLRTSSKFGAAGTLKRPM
ncbi:MULTISPECIES: hypothetical protein [Bradyrhizobium]|jgi:hypothetical protein|uniref:hypothetical protein n=1 Tax=Bradyrhizobium TaxID=374 RepID=UPI00192CD0A2|nr:MULTISPECIES: hypothetical protein [Bradyrhizobium]MDI2110468.1 hypothetical protein [Bradyrhizobium sp. Mp64]WLB04482.1 hypothetical protein QNJ80_21820 [Bradyrhizobium elkanii]